jgi:nucleoid-associated protein EbfC
MPQPPNLQKMLQQAQEMMAAQQEAQEALKNERVEASTGGGMVKVVMTGALELQSIAIDPDAVDPEDVEMLQDMVVAAINEALRKAEELQQSQLGSADQAGGFDPMSALESLGLGGMGGIGGGGGGGGGTTTTNGGHMTGGGKVPSSTDPSVQFSVNAFATSTTTDPGSPTAKGNIHYGSNTSCMFVSDSYTATMSGASGSGSSNSTGDADIVGTGQVKTKSGGRVKVHFHATARDGGESSSSSGTNDAFTITVDYPDCGGGGPLQNGNVQYHPNPAVS